MFFLRCVCNLTFCYRRACVKQYMKYICVYIWRKRAPFSSRSCTRKISRWESARGKLRYLQKSNEVWSLTDLNTTIKHARRGGKRWMKNVDKDHAEKISIIIMIMQSKISVTLMNTHTLFYKVSLANSGTHVRSNISFFSEISIFFININSKFPKMMSYGKVWWKDCKM